VGRVRFCVSLYHFFSLSVTHIHTINLRLGPGSNHPIFDYCDEFSVTQASDAFVSLGFKDAGYTGFHLDDCWADKNRNESGYLQGELDHFPNGMKPVVDHVHNRMFFLKKWDQCGLIAHTHTHHAHNKNRWPGFRFVYMCGYAYLRRWSSRIEGSLGT